MELAIVEGQDTKVAASLHSTTPATILLVEDSPGDRRLIHEALKTAKYPVNLYLATDGIEAMSFLRKNGDYPDAPRPDLIILDLNLPKKDGREVLKEVKSDDQLKYIPVIVLSSSDDETDIQQCYNLHANGYITKPVDLDRLNTIIQSIEDFWFTVAKLPQQ